jgi:hypothetical protein
LVLRSFLSGPVTSSRISNLEVRRAVARIAPRQSNFTNEVLKDFNFVPLDEEVLQIAEIFQNKSP